MPAPEPNTKSRLQETMPDFEILVTPAMNKLPAEDRSTARRASSPATSTGT